MHRRCRPLLALAALVVLLPLRAPGEAELPATDAQTNAAPAPATPTYGTTGKIERVRRDAIVVRRMGRTTQPNAPLIMTIAGGPAVPVSGEGRSHWMKLRRGDLVVVSYDLDPEPRAAKVLVLPPTAHPLMAAALGVTPAKMKGRLFTGWIKYKDESLLVVRTPDAAPPLHRPGKVRTFIRHEGTKVELFRDSWDALKKGDRVMVHYQKGNPRPADLVKVVLRGGEKPLPPGLATRLFDKSYDTRVKDVDGIGEIPPGVTWTPPKPQPSPPDSASN